eukprot:SAG31_NODE_2166_length_6280_cov_4.776250_7_plen_105_part_00
MKSTLASSTFGGRSSSRASICSPFVVTLGGGASCESALAASAPPGDECSAAPGAGELLADGSAAVSAAGSGLAAAGKRSLKEVPSAAIAIPRKLRALLCPHAAQ